MARKKKVISETSGVSRTGGVRTRKDIKTTTQAGRTKYVTRKTSTNARGETVVKRVVRARTASGGIKKTVKTKTRKTKPRYG